MLKYNINLLKSTNNKVFLNQILKSFNIFYKINNSYNKIRVQQGVSQKKVLQERQLQIYFKLESIFIQLYSIFRLRIIIRIQLYQNIKNH